MQFSENNSEKRIFGDDGIEETLLPIPNRKVKLYSANGTAWETVWESRTLPGRYGSIAQSVEQRTENPRVAGSIPARGTKKRFSSFSSEAVFCISHTSVTG